MKKGPTALWVALAPLLSVFAAPVAEAVLIGEAQSPPFGAYLADGFLSPAAVGIGQDSGPAFDLYTWFLHQGRGESAAFSLSTGGTVSAENWRTPRYFALEAPRPNPARGALAFGIAVPTAAKVAVGVYDVRGAHVAQVVDEVLMPGRHVRRWGGTDRAGRPLASGVYFVRLLAPGVAQLRKVVLIR